MARAQTTSTSTFNCHINRIAKEHGLKPVFLKDIIYYRSRGKNNVEITRFTGLDRNTVNKYVNELRSMNQNECSVLLFSVCMVKAPDEVRQHIIEIFRPNI